MTTKDMATKLGYEYTTKKTLVETPQGTFYTRNDHLLNKDGQTTIFRDRQSVELFLESKAQLEIPGTASRPAKAK